MLRSVFPFVLPVLALVVTPSAAHAADAPRDLDTHHLFQPPADRSAWQARRDALRRRILFSAGLWPLPEKTPLNPRVTGRTIGPDYIVENVAIETTPGFYLCGNVYLPRGKRGPFPGIVNPHGHWALGRLTMEPDVPRAAPPPAPPAPGRANLVAIGVNLARQGFVCFAYDMVGYADTRQIDHRFAGSLRPWLWAVSLNGLQLWNSLRAVDYLAGRPEVDPRRIGCTGASGGGTQTFELAAVDDRIAAAVPVNMISAYMQGGCLCENGPGLRVGTDNVEIGALMAPRPLLLVSATGDWTRNVPNEEWPAIRRVYALYGAEDRTAVVQFNYAHNYNVESREAMYAWFGKWLKGDDNPAHFREQPVQIDPSHLHVWREDAPPPDGAVDAEALLAALIDRRRQALSDRWPTDRQTARAFRALVAPALATSLAVDVPAAGRPSGRAGALVVAPAGDEAAAEALASLLRARRGRVEVLTLKIGPDDPARLWNAFYSTYNRTPVGDHVQRILDKLREVRLAGGRADLVGMGVAGRYALLAAALSPDARRVAVDLADFDEASDDAYIGALYAPGMRAAGGLPAAAVLCAPSPLCVFGAGPSFPAERIRSACAAAGGRCRIEGARLTPEQIAEWLGH